MGVLYCPGMEEVKVDLRVCESEHVPHHDWAAAQGAVFVYDPAPDQWANRDELNFLAPACVTIGGMEFWIGCKKLAYIGLEQSLIVSESKYFTIQPEAIVLREHTTPFMSLAATLNAIEESQDFEKLRRELMGAVERGKLWLE